MSRQDMVLPPTELEARLYDALDTLRLHYQKQRAFAGHLVTTAWLPGYALAVDISYTHYYHTPRRAQRDRELLTRHGVLAIYLAADSLQSNTQAIDSVRRILTPYVRGLTERNVS